MKTINSFRSKLFALTFALMASVSSFAYEFEYVNDFHIDGFAYSINSASANNDSEEGYVGLIEVADCQKDVLVPKYVSYGDRGFHVTKFGMGSVVFTNEAGSVVESVTIPNTTYVINKNVLAGCPNLKTVVVDSENPYYDSRENCNAIITTSQNPYFTPNTLIAGCKTTIIPNSVVEIGANAFYNCQSLETITIPNSVTKIGRSAFNACSALSSITLSENLTAIGEWAFDDCNNLIEVVCYATQPPTISQYTFSGISPTIYVPAESIEQYRAANGWKDLQIQYISWSEGCEEYKHINLAVQMLPKISSMIFDISNNGTIEPPYVDSVWILKTEQEPLRKLDAQSGDTIDLSFLEENEDYILRVYINGCIKSRTFWHRVIPNNWPDTWCDTWNVMWFDGWRFDETASTSKYRLGKDTVIGDYTYSKFTSRTSVRFTEDWKVYVYYEGFDDNDPYTVDLPTGEYLAYDFSAQVGDTLEVFSGVHSYSKYKCLVREVQTDPETKLRTITLFQLLLEDTDGDGVEEEYGRGEMTWIEGVGSPNGFLINTTRPGGGLFTLLCAYKDDELKYTGSFYERFGCEYNAGVVSDDLFPTLSGLQRTICREYCEQADNKTLMEEYTNLTTRTENDRPYIYCSPFLLREEDNKILIYSRSLNKDLVLYDFNLQVGDSLPMLYIDTEAKDDWIADRDMDIWYVVDYHKDLEGNMLPADTLIVTDISTITLLDGKEYKKWTFNNGMEYVEGIGSFGNGQWSGDLFQLIANKDVPTCLLDEHLVCASKNGQLLYQMDDAEMEQLETECLCEYNAEQTPEDLFPTLWGLQQTICSGYYGEEGDEWASGLTGPSQEITMMDGKPYLQWGSWYLREENDKILVYSEIQKKDLVLYDFTLELGDTLTTLNLVTPEFIEYEGIVGIVDYPLSDYDYTYPIDTLVVTELSKETLLDGKEYTRWKFSDGTVYVEGIGSMSETFFHHIADHLPVPVSYLGSYLVCVSKNNKLLYQMDDTEMERLGAECLCDYDRGPLKDNAKNGKIGGRPTPTQWNMLEVETKEMDGTSAIVRAETFSYTLENDSIVANGKTYYQLARQSTKDTAITKSFVGALYFSEDDGNRVYFLRDGVEYVLYDFTAEPGDTVETFAGINNYPQYTTYTHVVVDKDTTEDGACRMFLEVVFPEGTTPVENAEKVWLAGLGSIDGIVHNAAKRTSNAHAAPSRTAHSSDTQTSVMLCAWREDSCLYTTDHPDYDSFGCVYNQDPTSVENTHSPLPMTDCYKLLRNGQLLIIHKGKTYNVLGVPVE